MKIEAFQPGNYQQQFRYRSFLPSKVNLPWTWDSAEINTLLADANRHLGELNGLSLILSDVGQFIQMHVVKEAQISSKIEGTRTEMDEAVEENPDNIAPEKRDDWQEVRNYIAAMNQAIADLDHLPLSNRLLRRAHGKLLHGVRGEGKTPGEYRRSQNWIGGATLADAFFIPPYHEEVPELMSDLEALWHNEAISVPHLIRAAISHYQFETIHPFLDGNGRIGRLLITLYLVSHKMLGRPCLYISALLEKHRAAYYDALAAVRTRGDLLHWIKFFLVAVDETARKGVATLQAIHALKQRSSLQIAALNRRSSLAPRLLEFLFEKPSVSANQIAHQFEVSQPTAGRLIQDFMRLGILTHETGARRNRIYLFREYFDLFK